MDEHRSRPWELEPKGLKTDGIPADPAYITLASVPRRQLTRQEQLDLKPVVQRLYIEEGLTFAEVQRVLQTEYNFNPTKRQFATLQVKWGLKKNTRASDRQELLKKVNAGNLSEEGNVGTVSLNVEKVRRWRRELEERPGSSPRTPAQASEFDNKQTLSSAPYIASTTDPVSQRITPIFRISRQPSSPATFRVIEGLIFSISSYVSGMYEQKIWLPVVYSAGEVGPLQDQYTVTEAFQRLNKFFAACASAMELIKTKSYVEARRVLSAACNSVRAILEADHPDTLRYMINIFYYFLRDGPGPLFDAAVILKNYIARMGIIVLPKGHSWRLICQLLGIVDQAQLGETLLMAAELLTDVYKLKLGPYHETTAENQVMCFEWKYRNNLMDGEHAIQELLQHCPNSRSNFAAIFHFKTYLVSNLFRQGRYEEEEVIAQKTVMDTRIYGTYFHQIIALQHRANAEKMLGKYAEAFATTREVVDINYAREDPDSFTFNIMHLSRLEGWTREWGWIEEAEKIKAEIEALVARDTAGAEDALGYIEDETEQAAVHEDEN